MPKCADSPGVPLPHNRPQRVKSDILHVIALAQYGVAYTRSCAADSQVARLRLKTESDQLKQEVALLTEEFRTEDARLKRVEPQKRPHYAPTERMAILELRAACGWSVQQTADTFLVTAATIASWIKRVAEVGADAPVQIAEPVNKFPDFVRYRPHQSLGNRTLTPSAEGPSLPAAADADSGPIRCQRSLGGLLRHYYRDAA